MHANNNPIPHQVLRFVLACLGPAILTLSLAFSANAMTIKQITSPGGIHAWLVQEKNVPLITMHFGFVGGAAQDPDGKEGLAYFLSGMLDEGAGDLDSTAFQERMEELAVKLSFDTGRDIFSGRLRTLTKNRDDAFEMLRVAITEPRFDQDAVERIRKQILAGLKFDATDPAKVAALAWFKKAFDGHPYSRPSKGDVTTVQKITSDDLRSYKNKILARDTLKVAVVGDIDETTLGQALDKIFGGLPEKADLIDVKEAAPPKGPSRSVIPMDVPQSVAEFGFAGLKRKDPDFITAYVMNYILGGGGFSSRLTEEVREKRGLAYSTYTYLYPYEKGAAYIGNVATRNKAMGESLTVIRKELARLREEGVSEEELKGAKQYLTGSYPLRFDTSGKIASQLYWIQVEDLGVDYIEKRNELIEAVTLDDIRRVAKRLIDADNLIVTIVGKPEGLPDLGAKTDAGG